MGTDRRATPYGFFAADYEESRLIELCVPEGGVQTGPFGSQLHQRDYVEVGTPIITVEHLGDNRISHKSTPMVSAADRDRLSRYQLRPGDIVFSRVGSVDRRALVREEEAGWLFSGRCLRVRPNPERIDPTYLSYFFGHEAFKEYVRAIAVGATMPSINTEILSNVPVILPPTMYEQQAIASILGTLDDKIELNRRMSETLEEILRESHRDWFSSSNAKLLQDSSEAALTSSWAPGSVGDLAYEKREGVNPSMMAPDTPYIGLEHMPRRRITLDMWGTAEGLGSNKYHFERGDILFGKLRPYFHKVGVAPVDGICSTDMVVVVAKEKAYASFLLGVISSDEFVQFTDSSSTGTRMPRTSWKTMASYPIRIPPLALAHAYNDFAEPIIARTINATFENKTLAELRDTLLPKLISGELRVPQAEQLVSEVV